MFCVEGHLAFLLYIGYARMISGLEGSRVEGSGKFRVQGLWLQVWGFGVPGLGFCS